MGDVKYKVVGSKGSGFAVVDRAGATEYDLIKTRECAVAIKNVLNRGIGPEWDAVEAELVRTGKPIEFE